MIDMQTELTAEKKQSKTLQEEVEMSRQFKEFFKKCIIDVRKDIEKRKRLQGP